MFEPKILVEIIGKTETKKKKVKVQQDHIEVYKGRRGRGGVAYRPQFDNSCLVKYKTGIWPFRRLKQKLILVEGAEKCVSFYPERKTAEVPWYDMKAMERIWNAHVIKASGAIKQKLEVPTLLYIMIAAVLIAQILSALIFTGRIRFV